MKKNNPAPQKAAPNTLTVAQVNAFLRQQPHLASQLILPNHGDSAPTDNGGRVLSLHAAKSQKSLRELLGLKKKQADYVRTVADNQKVLEQIHTAALELLSCRNMNGFAACIKNKWPATLGIAAGALVQPKKIGFDHLAQKLAKKDLAIALFPLGELPQTSLESLFGAKPAKRLVGGSGCAMGLHNNRGALKAIVLLADADAETYYAGQDVALAGFLRSVAEKQLVGVR